MCDANSYGMNLTFTAVNNKDGKAEAAFTFKDTDGIKTSVKMDGDTYSTVVADTFKRAQENLKREVERRKAAEKKPTEVNTANTSDDVEKLKRELQSAKIDNEILKRRLDNANKLLDAKKNVKKDGGACKCAGKYSGNPLMHDVFDMLDDILHW